MRALLCTFLLPSLAGAVADPAVPPGFEPVPEKKVAQHLPDYLHEPSWMVTLVGDRVRVETRVAWVKRTRPIEAAEFGERKSAGKLVAFGAAKDYLVPGTGVPAEDGELFARDFGEFGGGIVFMPKSGEQTLVSSRCTPVMVRTAQGVFAFQELAHMGVRYADLVEVTRNAERWGTKPIASFAEGPSVIVVDGDRFLMAGRRWVAALEVSGKRRTLYSTAWEMVPESLVKRQNGEIWLGASWGILRLTPKANGTYAKQWYMATPAKKRATAVKSNAK